jgi:hypothetical protein
MREIVSVRMLPSGSWRAQLSCGHEDEAIYSTRVGAFRFCAFCKLARSGRYGRCGVDGDTHKREARGAGKGLAAGPCCDPP